jgi:hypothetical protein
MLQAAGGIGGVRRQRPLVEGMDFTSVALREGEARRGFGPEAGSFAAAGEGFPQLQVRSLDE